MKQKKNVTIQFLGAAGTVTGSKYLVETPDMHLLVDCGLFQGLKELRRINWMPLPVDVPAIDAVILTHGHLDHVGYLPLLVKQGFSGPIYATVPTMEIARLILLDSARIQEEDAERANRGGYSRHDPALPLYTVKEAEAVFPLFVTAELDNWMNLSETVSFRFQYNGHIIGATFVELSIGDKMLVFSGDIGRPKDPLLFPPQKPEHADFLFIESTYGNREHREDPKEQLAETIRKAASKQGTILIPSFAVERTQLLMYYLWELRQEKAIPHIPIYMDSPMGTHVLDVFSNNLYWHRISPAVSDRVRGCIHLVRKAQETTELAKSNAPKIIIAASGMATGGRILTYFEHFLGDANATILLVGHQGEGTRGRALLDGIDEIKMRGKYWKVRANIVLVEGLSAHADRDELIDWMSALRRKPEQVFIVHGEQEASEALKTEIRKVYGLEAIIPERGMKTELFKL
ncbi:MAG: MBL fold metallo-hydrolase [Candidatus Fluviicola riflensis]|nr:MAG: MBL fold metallo-hydrolase [Candidatus Fluviicola riflensis]OGS77838.1 MAG: MBL fold metallo-hydrolase [Candidatus Fluviicola riflensis]OGS84903.1 MAG: MBL fold metallo-hydrolase [Fluviicola sp. RIFCSPHIGHO2_01_FULL_43_53]OGS89175.1 MAG: MBL fold metallo-hydrolase [Fluviicola sp. RIFCSPHIGHO2_12_FULL_43_24]